MTFTEIDQDYDAPAEAFAPAPPPMRAITPSTRADGWTGEKQKRFLEAIADGATVQTACRAVVMSVASAYAFRRRAAGRAFALGWAGANLVARDRVAEDLLARAVDGQDVSTTRADGSVVVRHYFDNGLATRLLNRLDRYADAGAADDAGRSARLVAAEFDAYLDMVARDGGPARAALFMLARDGKGVAAELEPVVALARADRIVRCGVALGDEVSVADLDPSRREHWITEQWARAEAAGLIRLAAPAAAVEPAPASQLPQLPADEPVWWCGENRCWKTSFPPLGEFQGREEGDRGWDGYERELTQGEEAIMGAADQRDSAGRIARGLEERGRWFPQAAAEAGLIDLDAAADPADEAAPAPGSAPAGAEGRPYLHDDDRTLGADEASLVRDIDRNAPSGLDAPVGRVGAPSGDGVADRCTLPPTRAFRVFQFEQQELCMADTGNDVTVLNSLIKTVNDSIQGYQEAAKDIDNQRFTSMFQDRAMERQKVATMLQAEVGRLGGDPSDGGSLLGSAHQAFLGLKSAITGKDDDAILAEVQRGEEHLRDKFDSALADSDLGASTREVVNQAAQSVRQGADAVRGFNTGRSSSAM